MDLNLIEKFNQMFYGQEDLTWGDMVHSHGFLLFNKLKTHGLPNLGIEIKPYGLTPLESVLPDLHRELIEGCKDNGVLLNVFEDEHEELMTDPPLASVVEYFNYAKKLGWSLEHTADLAASIAFPALDLERLGSSSYTIGTQCYLLCIHGFIDFDIADTTFSGFIV